MPARAELFSPTSIACHDALKSLSNSRVNISRKNSRIIPGKYLLHLIHGKIFLNFEFISYFVIRI